MKNGEFARTTCFQENAARETLILSKDDGISVSLAAFKL